MGNIVRPSFSLGRVFGIPIGAHSSWLLIVALLAWSLAIGYFPKEYPGWTAPAYWIAAAITSLLFFASVLIHELGHSVLALRHGVPVRGITLFIFGGVALIGREPPTARAEFQIAIAGPITSFALGGAFSLLGWLMAGHPVASACAVYLGRINSLLALFNLIPGFPLDGGRILRAILWGTGGSFLKATRWASTVGQAVAFGFIFYGAADIFFGRFLNGLWIAFIGWFLYSAAEASYQRVVLRDTVGAMKARELMTEQCPTVPSDLRLDRLVHDHILGTGRRCFFVVQADGLEGLVTLHNIKEIPRERWDAVTAGQVMTPLGRLQWASPEDNIMTLLDRMDEADVNQIPVVDHGRLAGMISREQLLRYLRTRSELGI